MAVLWGDGGEDGIVQRLKLSNELSQSPFARLGTNVSRLGTLLSSL